MKKGQIQFANFVVKFGDDDLLDHSKIVLSAFLKDTHVRGYGSTHYHFLDVELKQIDSDVKSLVLSGRFVKSMVLSRDQILINGEIIPSPDRMDSAPSSFFTLVLATHRLGFAPETKDAPTLAEFESTCRRFVMVEFQAALKKIYRTNKVINAKFTWHDARRANPAPSVNVIPLTARSSISSFIGKFSKVESLAITLIERNSELDAGSAAANFQQALSKLNPRKAVAKATGGKDGLDIKETEDFVAETTHSGYENVTVKGIDKDGNKLQGNNDKFKLVAEFDPKDGSIISMAKTAYSRYKDLVSQGMIKLGIITNDKDHAISEKLRGIVDDAKL